MKIKTRDARDPGGKVVDILQAEGDVTLLLFAAGEDTSRGPLCAQAVSVLRALAGSPKASLRNRDFPVWFVEVQQRPEIPALTGLALPSHMASAVFVMFHDALSTSDAFRDAEGGRLEHLRAEPLLRYAHGDVIAYGDPMDGVGEVPADGIDEVRSAEVPGRVVPRPTEPDAASPVAIDRWHTLASWTESASAVEAWIDDLSGPLGFDALRSKVHAEFGISVHEEPVAAAVGKYGCIRTGWLQPGGACTVRILLAPHHHRDLKYAILAHELGHYCRHFPLLHYSQFVEETSWVLPEVRRLYDALVEWQLAAAGLSLEDDANAFASCLLITPRYLPAGERASGVFNVDRPLRAAEVIFNGLQPLFPGTRARFAAMSLDEMRAAAGEQIAALDLSSSDDDSIYLGMLRGCVAREDRAADQLERGVAQAMANVIEIMDAQLSACADETPDESPTARRAWWQRLLAKLEIDQRASAGEDVHPELAAGARKAVFAPLEWNGETLYPCIPLIPAGYNLAGDPENDWRCLVDDAQPPGTVGEWRQAWPDRGLAVYRLETWQQEGLSHAAGLGF
jgi:hypothetical protein